MCLIRREEVGGGRGSAAVEGGEGAAIFNPLSQSSLPQALFLPLCYLLPLNELLFVCPTTFLLPFFVLPLFYFYFLLFLLPYNGHFLGFGENIQTTPPLQLLSLEGKGHMIVSLLKALYSRNQAQALLLDSVNNHRPTETQTKG